MVACAYIYKARIADLEEEYAALNAEALALESIASQPGATQEQIDAAIAKRADADAKQARLNQVLAW